jgi:hypothetical protein
LLLTSGLLGVALWALRQATLQNEAVTGGVTRESAAPPREEIQASERQRLNAVLRQTDKQDRRGAPAK